MDESGKRVIVRDPHFSAEELLALPIESYLLFGDALKALRRLCDDLLPSRPGFPVRAKIQSGESMA